MTSEPRKKCIERGQFLEPTYKIETKFRGGPAMKPEQRMEYIYQVGQLLLTLG
jgi:hypothetical protein